MKAILHIGYPKTGTTTIQKHLAGNRPGLRKQGFFVPKYNALHDSLEDLDLENGGARPDSVEVYGNRRHAVAIRPGREQMNSCTARSPKRRRGG